MTLLGVLPNQLSDLLVIDQWLAPTGARISVSGHWIFLEDDPQWYLAQALEADWARGYTPFFIMLSRSTAAELAFGPRDEQIQAWGRVFAQWARNGKRRAFLAPLAEMNGRWSSYYSDPDTSKYAYRHVRDGINAELVGIPHTAVSWVFAPNGWAEPNDGFEKFYPGPDAADLVGFSSYNFGGCPSWDDHVTFESGIKPYCDRLAAMAPGKGIVLTTGTVDVGVDKDQWLGELFTRSAQTPNMAIVLYQSTDGDPVPTLPRCPVGPDFRLHVPGTDRWQGAYRAMADSGAYRYAAPNGVEMDAIFNQIQPDRRGPLPGRRRTDSK